MKQSEILSKVDHTCLKPEATWAQIKQLCNEALQYKTASVCIQPCFVKQAVEHLKGEVKVCTVIGFPLGTNTTNVKVQEARDALLNGCDEFDMVINIGRLKMGDYAYVLQEIAEIKKAIGEKVLKVIIETCLLTDEEKEKMCEIVLDAGADYIKTSTGFGINGATVHDIQLFARCVKGRCKIKAAGGIQTVFDMENFISLGASRLGTSSAVKILRNEQTGESY